MLLGKYINKYYLKYIILYIIGIIALILVDYLQLLIPEKLGQIVNLVNSDSNINVDTISNIILVVVYVAIGLFIGKMIWRYTIFNASQRIESKLRSDMFLHAEELSLNYFYENNVGSIMAWFTSDLEVIEEFLGWGTIMLVDAFFLSLLILYKMFKLDFVLTLITLIPILLIVFWGLLVEKHMGLRWEKRQKEYDRLYDFSRESFSGIRVIKAFVKESAQIHRFAHVAKKNKDTNIEFVKVSVLFDNIISIIIACVMTIILGLGGYFVYSNITGSPVIIFNHTIDLDAGSLITYLGYFEILIWPMMALGQVVSMRSRAGSSYKRIDAFLNSNVEIKNPLNPIFLSDVKGSIEFKNFSFKYPNTNNECLNNINLNIEAGQTIGIIGKIGSGKTTLVNLLLRLYNVEDDTLFIDGKDIMKCDIKSVRKSIAYVPQENFLFSDSIKNNIAFSNKDLNLDEIIKSAKFADVHENIINFKDGYDTQTGERGVSLSGGQKQRLSIARAYACEAPIMILDDSVSAVDIKTEEIILKNIKEMRKGKTTIIISSRASTVSKLDKIIVLSGGMLEAFDTPSNLLKTSPTYQTMISLQQLEDELKVGDENE